MKDIERKVTYPVVFVISEKDFPKFENNIPFFKEYLPASNYIIISKHTLKDTIQNYGFRFIDEDCLYPGLTYTNIANQLKNKINDCKRTGWYLQQFLKMSFSTISKDDYYLLWDADTIPLEKVVYDKNKPRFDIKTEFHEQYFKTINKIFPELHKRNNFSFISEHMFINAKIMREIIKKIESNYSINGVTFYEKILNSIDINELSQSGFSEFETYGTYIDKYYNSLYFTQEWKSLRGDNDWCTYNDLTKHIIKWLNKDFNAISFESWTAINTYKRFFVIFCSYFINYNFCTKLYNKFISFIKRGN